MLVVEPLFNIKEMLRASRGILLTKLSSLEAFSRVLLEDSICDQSERQCARARINQVRATWFL